MSYDPADGTPGIDDNAPGSPPDPDPAPGRRQLVFAARHTAIRCASCGDAILLGPVCCPACIKSGYCSICGQHHRAWQCPEVVKVREEMMAAERATRQQTVRDWANALLAQYLADPITA